MAKKSRAATQTSPAPADWFKTRMETVFNILEAFEKAGLDPKQIEEERALWRKLAMACQRACESHRNIRDGSKSLACCMPRY